MPPPAMAVAPERLRRLTMLWRALYTVQVVLVLLAVGAALVELIFPGMLAMLVRNQIAMLVVGIGFLAVVAVNDLAAALVERSMHRIHASDQTAIRRVVGIISFVPYVMSIRRLLQLAAALTWLILRATLLVLWITSWILLSPFLLASGRASAVFGALTDYLDRMVTGFARAFRGRFVLSVLAARLLELVVSVLLLAALPPVGYLLTAGAAASDGFARTLHGAIAALDGITTDVVAACEGLAQRTSVRPVVVTDDQERGLVAELKARDAVAAGLRP